MIALAIVLIVIIFIALLRFALSAEYSADGFFLVLKAGFLSFRLIPAKEKTEKKILKAQKKKEKKELKKKEKAEREPEEKRPGTLKTVLNMLPEICKTLNRLRRKLLIKRLKIRFIAADEDPVKAALTFGASNALFGVVLPLLESAFRVKRRDVSSSVDFNATEQSIYLNAAISIAVWEAVYITFAALPALIKIFGKQKTTGKDDESYGKAPDKRLDGNDHAKGQRDDRRQHDNR